ncbi:multiple sugar transport system permease protein [Bogoriella caseilytica]|uniref:Multiple sugar transport system permease protein n=1 Tax=Bogoriella caseilytica TaxID=56055 RepID=A0A3N2BCR7_9MICO|nr:multiple sugar transport system permease protein [Bogoriella caseilytica]
MTPERAGRIKRPARSGRAWARAPWYAPWLFMGVALLIIATFIVFPFFNTFALSFTDATLLRDGRFIGLGNFRELLSDARFGSALLNSSLYVVVVVPVMVVLPLILATLAAGDGRFLGFFRTSYYLPVIMSPVIVGLIWTNMLERRGLVNEVLGWLQIVSGPIPFLTDRWLLLFSAMFVTIWMGMGYYMVIYLAALANIDPSLYDAASVDGAGVVRKFLSVTIPGVRNTMGLIGIFSSIAAFRVFGEVYVLTDGTGGVGGENVTMTMLIQREGTGLQAQTGYAGAISLVMFVIMAIFLVLQLVTQNRQGKNS